MGINNIQPLLFSLQVYTEKLFCILEEVGFTDDSDWLRSVSHHFTKGQLSVSNIRLSETKTPDCCEQS